MCCSYSMCQCPGIVAPLAVPKTMSPRETSKTSSSDGHSILSSDTQRGSSIMRSMFSQSSAKRCPPSPPLAACPAAKNSNLDGGQVDELPGLNLVMRTLGIGRVIIASSPLETLWQRVIIASHARAA